MTHKGGPRPAIPTPARGRVTSLERRLTGRLFAAAAILGGVLLLALGAGMTFFSDEWAFIESRSLGDPLDWFQPHNEHWSTLPIIVYRLIVETIGIGSHMPYLAAVVGQADPQPGHDPQRAVAHERDPVRGHPAPGEEEPGEP
jgi:hypothetical protein